MDIFKFCPLQEGYSFTAGNNVREQKTEVGMPRQVIKFVGAIHQVNATVLLKDPLERQLFWAFWRLNQTKLWQWRLALDNGILEDCICQFSAEEVPRESVVDGKMRKISLHVYVLPIQRDPEFDKQLILLWQQCELKTLSDIEKVPNIWLPNALGD